MNESAYTKKLRKRLIEEGAVVWKWHGSGMGINGVPDLYVASTLWSGWIEVKVARNKASASQSARIEELNQRCVDAFVLRGPDHQIERPDGTINGHLDWSSNLLAQLFDESQTHGLR